MPPRELKRRTVLVRIVLGLVFIYSSFPKILDPSAFATIVTNYRILPPQLVPMTAVILPWVEAVCGFALIIGRWEKGAALLVCLMMAVFLGLTWYNSYRGLNIACGCFSLTANEPSHIFLNTIRNLVIMAAGTWVLFSSKDRKYDSIS